MALPSQTFGNTRFNATRRPAVKRGRLLRRGGALVLAIGVVLLGWWMWSSGGSDPKDSLRPEKKPSLDRASQASPNSTPLTRGSNSNPPASKPPRESLASPAIAGLTGSESRNISKDTERADEPDSPARVVSAPNEWDNKLTEPEATQAKPETSPPPVRVVEGSATVQDLIAQGRAEWQANKPLQARETLNRAMYDAGATEAQRSQIRGLMMPISDLVTFSPRVFEGDEMSSAYAIVSGDSLQKIARNQRLNSDWRLIQRVNQINDPRRIRVDQRIKLLRGPFHAVITKSAYRVDIYSDFRDAYGNRLYITSRPCGLGEFDSTPVGMWVVRSDSKLVNPHWINPRTREHYSADDPENPIGEYWIGIRGIDESTKTQEGYGLHGTIDPESIGGQESMGCVRMLPDDIALMYELLYENESTVEIVP